VKALNALRLSHDPIIVGLLGVFAVGYPGYFAVARERRFIAASR
jgi:hypothetical protein